MAEPREPGRAVRKPERFEVFEADPTAHLTEEQKTWKVVKLRPIREHFEILEQQPIVVLKLHLRQKLEDADQVALAKDIFGLILVLSEAERELGGGGLVLSDQKAEAGAVVLKLRHVVPEGAAERAVKLAQMLNNAVEHARVEPAGVLALLGKAAGSPAGRVNLLLTGSGLVSRCELLNVAA